MLCLCDVILSFVIDLLCDVILSFVIDPFTAAPSRAYGAVLRVADPRLGRMQVFFVQNLLF